MKVSWSNPSRPTSLNCGPFLQRYTQEKNIDWTNKPPFEVIGLIFKTVVQCKKLPNIFPPDTTTDTRNVK